VTMENWINRYPGVQALLQQAEDVLDEPCAEDAPIERQVLCWCIETFRHGALEVEDCFTPRPAPVCTCGRYALTWETRADGH
jgi:hypothetical protein